jgi:Flp pilus assembly protein TadG
VTSDAVARSLLRLRRDQRGIAAVTVAISLPLLFAFGALAINSGLWFTIKRENQSAADAAAISAAYELMAGPPGACKNAGFVTDRLTPAATQAVAANQHQGWDNTGTTTTVTCPYTDILLDTEFPSGYQAVAVTLLQDQSSLFAFVPASTPSATIGTRAVGVVKIFDTPCILALGKSGTDVYLQGAATISTPGCSIVADSTDSAAINLHDAADHITADTLVTPGNIAVGGSPVGLPLPSEFTLTKPPLTGLLAPTVPDPYESTLTHSFLTTGMPSSCAPTPGGGTTVINADTRFCGLSIKGETIDLQPPASGHLTIWITDDDLSFGPGTGTLECTTCNVSTGVGVTIILTTGGGAPPKVGGITMQGSPTINNLNAPDSGIFKGLLVIQDSNNLPVGTTYTTSATCPPPSGLSSPCSVFEGTPALGFNGLVYFPKTNLAFQGNSNVGSRSCLLLVVNQAALVGSSSLASSGCTASGLGSTPKVQTVVLAE